MLRTRTPLFCLVSQSNAIALFASILLVTPDHAWSQDVAPDLTVTSEETSATSVETTAQVVSTIETPRPPQLSVQRYQEAVSRWEGDIQKLEALDAAEPDPEDAVLLVGSSSIRLWDGAVGAMKPYPIIRRGYGGAKYSDLLVYARRLIEPHEYQAIVFFVGNDVSGGKTDHAVEDVEKWVRAIVKVARDHQPDAAILLVEVTPTPVRFDAWPKIRKLNAMLREVALTEPNTSFVSTAEFYLDRDDQPRRELFRDDNLHQNETGYQVWASLIKRRLDEVLATQP